MLKGKTVVVEHLQYLHTEACLVVHHSLFDIDSAEALLACDTCDGVAEALSAEIVVIAHDHSTRILGSIGIPDIDGDTCGTNREDSVLVKNGSAHVSQLAELAISNYLDNIGVVNYSGVGNQKSRNICPVLIYLSLYSICDN